MRVIVCGRGRTGAYVTSVLEGVHDVTVVDRAAERLPAGLRCVAGDATDPHVLSDAGARGADVLLALTADDATNLLIATLAKRRLGVASVVARVNDPAHAWLFAGDAGVDVTVSAAELTARLVQEAVTAGDLVTLLRLRGGGVAVTETTLPPGAAAAGLRVRDLEVPEGVAFTAVVRGGDVLLPERAGRLIAGDVVVALCEPGREHALHQALAG